MKLFIAAVAMVVMALAGCKQEQTTKQTTAQTGNILDLADKAKYARGPQAYISFLDSALAGQELGPADRFQVYIKKHAHYLNYADQYYKAQQYADSLLELIDANRDVFDSGNMFHAYMSKANVCYKLNRYSDAFKYYAKAKAVAYSCKSDCEEGVYLFRIAMSFYHEEKYLESARLFNETSGKLNTCKNESQEYYFRRQETIGNTGLAYFKAGLTDSSIHYYSLAVAYIQHWMPQFPAQIHNWEEALSVVYGNMGSSYVLLKNTDSAETYYLKSLALNEAANRNLIDRLFNLIKLAELYTDAGKYKQAEKLLDIENNLFEETSKSSGADSLDLVYRSAGAKWKYYQKTGDYSKAILYLQQHHEAQEAKTLRTQKNANYDLAKGIDNVEHETQIANLEKDVQIRRQNNIIMALTVILIAGALMVIYRSLKRFQQNYKTLEQKTEKITVESAIKEEELQRKIKTDQLNFLALIENTDDFLWSVDLQMRYLAFNKPFKDYLYKLFEVYPRTGQKDILQEKNPVFFEKIRAGYVKAFEGAAHQILEKGIVIDGFAPDIEIRFKPIKDEHGNIIGVSCFRRNITDFLGLIRKLALNNEQLKKIAWVQSHKLRGPLTTIKGITSAIIEHELDQAHIALMMASLQEKVEEMDGIIHEIVAMSDDQQEL